MKIVKESLNFERGLEPKTAMGIGVSELIDKKGPRYLSDIYRRVLKGLQSKKEFSEEILNAIPKEFKL